MEELSIMITVGTGLGIASAAGGMALLVMTVPEMPSSVAPTPEEVPAPVVAPEEPNKDEIVIPAPVITLVRVDQQGTAVIGGTAEPGIALRALFGDEDILATRAEASGDFVMLADLPTNEEPRELTVVSYNDDGTERARSVPVLILGRKGEEPPTVVVNSDEGASLVQAAPATSDEPPVAASLSLDTITYDEEGAVSLGGRGNLARAVRIYLDNEPLTTRPVDPSGSWNVELPTVDPGIYTLRVDELSPEGDVTSRVESPFKKEQPQLLPGEITVQPGNTLWALAAENFGEGDRYVVIFEANKDLIRDPNLIYPGQIFTLPEE